MTKALSVLSGAGVGAGMMYLLDLDQGKRRRAFIRDQAARSARKTRDAVAATDARCAASRAGYGLDREVVGFFAAGLD